MNNLNIHLEIYFLNLNLTCFSLLVMTVILVNCIYMAANQEIPDSEAAFTSIYTIESSIKILARGLIMGDFTYLKDVWNWLDFIVVSLAYVTIAFPVGNLAVLRTFRVLRALKTVAVVPGLKTIVGALMEAVRRLRDVMILTVFVLSIFALVGLQIYQGTLKNKCVHDLPSNKMVNHTFWIAYTEDKSNWFFSSAGVPKICGNGSESGKCPANYTCLSVGPNPNYGYTNFDNYGYAMLCAFRLMTQDCWENLYQMVLTANGPYHIIFFIIVIFLGSFYLVNLILAIVAMSYDDCQKMDRDEEEAEAILVSRDQMSFD
uniref:Putative voltage-gated sodium channel 3 n=1 Tax=Hirudo verbana TaxID=311461 RepID=A0A2S1WMD2_9ANNE|nr:putative voltage-gated sodium channel 3 [Hirudo verbana]